MPKYTIFPMENHYLIMYNRKPDKKKHIPSSTQGTQTSPHGIVPYASSNKLHNPLYLRNQSI